MANRGGPRAAPEAWVVVVGLFMLVLVYGVVCGPDRVADGSSYCDRHVGTCDKGEVRIPPILRLSKDWLGR